MSWFTKIENVVLGFFHSHGEAALLEFAKKVVPEVESEVKHAIEKIKAEEALILPIVESYVSKYVSPEEAKAFVEGVASKVQADLPVLYQKVAAFVMSKLANGNSAAHLINLAIEYVYSIAVKAL